MTEICRVRTLPFPFAVLAVALALALALAIGCTAAEEEAPPQPPLVVLAPVDGRDLEEHIEATGQLLAVDEADIAAEVEGRITEILADEGDPVEEGGEILLIDPERRELELADATAQVAEARAAHGEARRERSRVSKLQARGAASSSRAESAQSALEAAASRLRAAEARLGVADRSLRNASVKAPFSGLVSRRFVSRGEYVRPGDKLVSLVALDPIEVELHLPEQDSSRVSLGADVDVRVSPYPDEVFDATVSMISPTIDPRTRTLRVKAVLDNSDGRLRPGLFARAGLGMARRTAVAMIPEEAVLQRADGAVIFRYDGEGRVQRRVIETGVHRDGEVEILFGLEPGDWVVTRGHASLMDGSPVRPQNPDGSPFTRPLASVGSASEGGVAQ